MNTATDWVSAIAILAAGLILGALFVYFNKRKAAQTIGGDVDLERKDLEAKRDALVTQLRDASLSAEERQRLELETADTLRRLDKYQRSAPATAATASDASPNMAMNPTIKGFIWGATSMAALMSLGYFVMQQSTPRQQGAEITGGTPQQQAPMQAGAQQQQQNDPVIQQLQAAVNAQPNNLQLRNDLAQAYLERENLMAVFEQTKFVLEQAPENSRALTLQGLVRMAMGETEDAMKMLQRATKNDPKNLDGYVALAWVYAQTGRMSQAEEMIAEASRQVPEQQARLQQVFSAMKQQLAGGGLPAGHPNVDGAPAATAANTPAPAPAAAASGPGVHVTLDLDPSATKRTGIVFVIARNPAGGPPVAVKRVVATSFPLNVDITAADSMMGQALPPSFRVEARLDSDGDPLTKPETDPKAAQEGVAPGATVKLALK